LSHRYVSASNATRAAYHIEQLKYGENEEPAVELLARYSNRPELLRPLADVLRRSEAYVPVQDEQVKSRRRTWSVRERLAPQDVHDLVDLFMAGTPKTQLAAKFGISLSTVKRLLRKIRHGEAARTLAHLLAGACQGGRK
jgi:FixJ family two-component response regulator